MQLGILWVGAQGTSDSRCCNYFSILFLGRRKPCSTRGNCIRLDNKTLHVLIPSPWGMDREKRIEIIRLIHKLRVLPCNVVTKEAASNVIRG